MANKLQKKKHGLIITIDPDMRDYSNDPFIVKKVERARAFIAKHGLPKQDRTRKSK